MVYKPFNLIHVFVLNYNVFVPIKDRKTGAISFVFEMHYAHDNCISVKCHAEVDKEF